MEIQQVIELLKEGKIAVIPADTIYGIVGSAFNPQTVEEIYKLRKRAKDKPMIILISSIKDLRRFGVKLTKQQKGFLQRHWPNPLSVILSCQSEKFAYLHRGTESLAFRMPKDKRLLKILKAAGPLVAPSANIAGGKCAENVLEARKYFGGKIAFYLNGGDIKSTPSTLIKLKSNGSWKVLRQGSYSSSFPVV